jgi:predicted Zn-dependent protease
MTHGTERGEFSGGVFSDTIEGGRAGARVSLEPEGLLALTAEGQSFRVAYGACEVELGGASGRMWFCRSRSPSDVTIFSEAPGFFAALAAAAPPDLQQRLARHRASAQQQGKRRALFVVALLGALLGLATLGYFGIKQAGSASVLMLPRSVDEQLGELAIDHMDLEGTAVEDPKLVQGVERIMKRLAPGPVDGFRFQPRVVDASVVNAFALPGGPMVVYTGLIRKAKTPEQLAGVLAHEMAHVTRRHGMKRIAQSVGVVAAIQLLLGDVSGVAAVGVELLKQGAVNSYSREQEHEADMDAVRTLAKARIDPNALAEMFVILEQQGPKLPSVVSWLGTHPDMAQRIKDVRAAAAKSGWPSSPSGAAGAQPHAGAERLLENWPEIVRQAGGQP